MIASTIFGEIVDFIARRSPEDFIAFQHSEPEPDLSVLSWRDDYYRDKHPGAASVILLIEVADSSLEYDREIKLPAYAAAGIRGIQPSASITIWKSGLLFCLRLVGSGGEVAGRLMGET